MSELDRPRYRITVELVQPGKDGREQSCRIVAIMDSSKVSVQRAWLTPGSPRISVDLHSAAFKVEVGLDS